MWRSSTDRASVTFASWHAGRRARSPAAGWGAKSLGKDRGDVMSDVMQEQFSKMGARVKVKPSVISHNGYPVRVDVRRDAAGEYFELRHGESVGMSVLEVTPGDRHLVLRARVD